MVRSKVESMVVFGRLTEPTTMTHKREVKHKCQSARDRVMGFDPPVYDCQNFFYHRKTILKKREQLNKH